MGIYEELQARGLIAQVTDEERIRDLVNNGKATFYIGFDPTADSLHVGHFMALCLMKRLQEAGNKPKITKREKLLPFIFQMPHPHPLLPQHLLYLLILNHLLPVILPSSSTGFLIPVFFFEHPVPVISIATILPVKTKTFPHFFISNTSLFNITNQLLSVYRISIFVNQFTHSCHTWIYHIFYDTFLID